jgi:putative ABC transport system permease protein
MDGPAQNLRVGVRSLLASPLTTIPAILSLALGIAATTTIFSVTDIVLFQPLRFHEPERLMAIWGTHQERGWIFQRFSIPDLLDYRERSRTLDIAGYRSHGVNLSGTEQPERLSAMLATSNIFAVTGFKPVHGRAFTRDEEIEGHHRVVLLGADLWQRNFGSNPNVIGQTVKLDGIPYTVIGIMPPAIPYPFYQVDAWMPPGIGADEHRGFRTWKAVGRLQGSATQESAHAELTALAAGLATEYASVNAGIGARLIPLREDVYGEGPRYGSIILLTAAFFVLLIACANVANLLLARAFGRHYELAIRTALGARRGHLVRQLLTESTLLGLGGGALGVLVSIWGIQALDTIVPADPPIPPLGLDLRVLGFAAVVAALAGILVGMVPAFRTSRTDVQAALTAAGRGSTSGAGKRRMQEILVASQIALALVLLVCASILLRTGIEMQRSDMGFDPNNLLLFRISPPETKYPETDSLRMMYASLSAELQALPGVDSVATVSSPPLTGRNTVESYAPEGQEYGEGELPVSAVRWADPSYFDTIDVSVVHGRGFSARDVEGSPRVIVISEALATRHWAEESPVGKRIAAIGETWEIAGVVEDLHHFGPDSPPTPTLYFPTSQSQPRAMAVLLRTEGAPEDVIPSVRATVLAIDPDQPIYEVTTMQERLRVEFEGYRIVSDVSAVLGMVALIMAVVGVYGVMAYSVAQRVHETGIRMALGATPRDVRRLMTRRGAVMAVLGLALGILLSLGMMRIFASAFHDFIGFDGLSLIGATVVLLAAALGASYLPARSAARLDPVVALRNE